MVTISVKNWLNRKLTFAFVILESLHDSEEDGVYHLGAGEIIVSRTAPRPHEVYFVEQVAPRTSRSSK